ncbi:hypothetical protein ACWFMI_24460 [Nocardiopsis terrae]
MYEYRNEPEVTYTIRIDRADGSPSDEVRMTVGTNSISEHLDEAAQAFFASLAEHYDVKVTQSVRATGTRPGLVFPAE